MESYAQMELSGYDLLCLEFLSTLDIALDFNSFHCRLLGNAHKVRMSIMYKVFRFHKKGVGIHLVHSEFNPNLAWREIKGFNN